MRLSNACRVQESCLTGCLMWMIPLIILYVALRLWLPNDDASQSLLEQVGGVPSDAHARASPDTHRLHRWTLCWTRRRHRTASMGRSRRHSSSRCCTCSRPAQWL